MLLPTYCNWLHLRALPTAKVPISEVGTFDGHDFRYASVTEMSQHYFATQMTFTQTSFLNIVIYRNVFSPNVTGPRVGRSHDCKR